MRGNGGNGSDNSCRRSQRFARHRFYDFHLLPGSTPNRETVLEPGDLITHVTLPPPIAGSKQLYLKLRDRASYEFALASAAVVITVADGNVKLARIAIGGVGTSGDLAKPRPLSLARRQPTQISVRQRRRRCATPNRRARTDSK